MKNTMLMGVKVYEFGDVGDPDGARRFLTHIAAAAFLLQLSVENQDGPRITALMRSLSETFKATGVGSVPGLKEAIEEIAKGIHVEMVWDAQPATGEVKDLNDEIRKKRMEAEGKKE